MFVSISMTAPPTGVLLASNFRCCKVARLRGLSYQGGGKKILRSYASSLCNRKELLFVFFSCFVFFCRFIFFIPRVPIYIPIYIVYIKFLLSLVTLICSYDLYYISLSMSQCPSFQKNVSSFYFVSSFGQGYVIRYFLGWLRVGQNTVS